MVIPAGEERYARVGDISLTECNRNRGLEEKRYKKNQSALESFMP